MSTTREPRLPRPCQFLDRLPGAERSALGERLDEKWRLPRESCRCQQDRCLRPGVILFRGKYYVGGGVNLSG